MTLCTARTAISVFILTGLVACSGAAPTELEDSVGGGASPTSPGPGADPGSADPGGPVGGGSGSGSKGSGGADGACKLDPTAFDIPGNGKDDDCNGKVDDVDVCDGALAIGATDATDAAKALGVCKLATGNAWGVVSAKWLRLDGAPLPGGAGDAFGLLTKLGAAKPVAGSAMLALSSGVARGPGDPGYVDPANNGKDRGWSSPILGGLKPASSLCPATTFGEAHDGVVLELALRVPSNARSLSFTHQFFTPDYLDYVCSEYDDFFAVTMDPKPADRPDGNITVDAAGDPISVNSTFIRACAAGSHANVAYSCPLGGDPLAGTGYQDHASTGWLTTSVGVAPGSLVTLRFMIWDSGDGEYDSTALVDGLSFSASPVTTTTTVAIAAK